VRRIEGDYQIKDVITWISRQWAARRARIRYLMKASRRIRDRFFLRRRPLPTARILGLGILSFNVPVGLCDQNARRRNGDRRDAFFADVD